MQHINSEYTINSRQHCLLQEKTTASLTRKASHFLRTHLAKSWLLPAVLLCGASTQSLAQTTCSLQLTTAVTSAACGATGTINLGVTGGTGAYAYAWTGPNGFVASTEDLSGVAAGIYSVTVTDNTTQCSTTGTATVAATPDTTPPILRAAGFEATLVNGVVTILADDVDYGSFDTCSGLASINVSPSTFTCANVGSNNVTFTATDNAGNAASVVVTVVVLADATCLPLSGTAATAATQRLQVYPNPAASTATVVFVAEQAGAAHVVVYNSLGQQVATLYNGAVHTGQEYRFPLQGAGLADGVYTCQVRTAGRVYTTRLLIAR